MAAHLRCNEKTERNDIIWDVWYCASPFLKACLVLQSLPSAFLRGLASYTATGPEALITIWAPNRKTCSLKESFSLQWAFQSQTLRQPSGRQPPWSVTPATPPIPHMALETTWDKSNGLSHMSSRPEQRSKSCHLGGVPSWLLLKERHPSPS